MIRKITIALSLVFISVAAVIVWREFSSEDANFDATRLFVDSESGAQIDLNRALKADTVCLISAGIDPFAYSRVKFRDKRVDRADTFESEATWAVVAIEDRRSTARILDVDRRSVDTAVDAAVCSRNMLVKIERIGIRRVVSVIARADATTRDRVAAMLEAINSIRERRDIKLDCEKYVYPYLGRSDRLKHYLDLFAANVISPNVTRHYEKRHIGFRIHYSHLKKIRNSKFGNGDIVAIGFWAEGDQPNSAILSCEGTLFAAPAHL